MSFKLHLIHTDKSEHLLYQEKSSPWAFDLPHRMKLYYKALENSDFILIQKQSSRIRPSFDISSSGFYGVFSSADWVGSTRQVPQLPGGLNIIEVNQELRSVTTSHTEHVREHIDFTREMRELEMARHEASMARRELERRAYQAEEERLRLEEERNRPRRPWDRARNLFR